MIFCAHVFTKEPFDPPAVLVVGLFACSQTSLADETVAALVSGDEGARAAEIARSVTANGERRAQDEPLTIAQVAARPAEELNFPDEAEVNRVVVTGTNIASDSSCLRA